jgi:Ca2+-binding EF-hand superfamily protein
MTFLHADKDGGNLLDIQEIENILAEMKIKRSNEEILRDIEEINKILY